SIKMMGHKLIAHDGGLPGVVTTSMRFPDDKLYVCVLCNLEGSATGKAARDLAAIALGEPYDIPVDRKEAKIDPKVLDALVGDYEIKPARIEKWPLFGDVVVRRAEVLKIARSGDELYGQPTGQPRLRLQPESENTFFAPTVEVVVTF